MNVKKVCKTCHIVFDKRLTKCPSCGREVVDENKKSYINQEGFGRKYRAGGEACDYCAHCYGSADWCLLMY